MTDPEGALWPGKKRRLSPGPQQAYSLHYHSNKDQASYVCSTLMIPPWLVWINPEIDQVIKYIMDTKLGITVDGVTQDFLGAKMADKVTENANPMTLTQSKKTLQWHMLYSTMGFARSQNKVNALQRDTVWSKHGYIIHIAGCPTIWKSQLQREIV